MRVTRTYLATGYWNDPARTAEAFGDNPDGTRSFVSRDIGRLDQDGQLRLIGRRDHSVKIRGYLVEPGDVDAVLFARPEVREVVTVGRPRVEDQVMHLVSYVVPAGGQVSPAALRAAVGQALPSYMVPQAVVLLDALPRTERGKVDRASLPEPARSGAGSVGQAFSSWERVVADVWARVLFLDDVGLDDDFFELGGDSLAAEALIATMIGDLGVSAAQANTAVLAQAPTVRSFAARLTPEPVGDDVLIPLQIGGALPTLFVVAGGGGGLGVAFLRLARHLGPDRPVVALQAHGMERRGRPDWSVRAIARRNVAAIRSMQPHGPYHLAGHSFGGLVAFEMAHQLDRAGEQVGQLIVLDSFPPDPHLQPRDPALPMLARLKQAIGLALTGIHGAEGTDQYWRFYRLSGVLARRYRSRPWSGDTLVVVAATPEKDVRAAWADHLSGAWQAVEVAGDHLSMIREPYVVETAEVVSAALGARQDGHAAGGSRRQVSTGP